MRPDFLLAVRESTWGRQASAPFLVALAPLLGLAACAVPPTSAHATLAAMGFTRVETMTEPWLGSPCLFSEPYATRFSGLRAGALWTGVLCATGPDDERPMLRDLQAATGRPLKLSGTR